MLAERLDEAALLIAAHARTVDRPLDLEAQLAHIDSIAAACGESTAHAVLHQVFDVEGFRGDADDYYNPLNSYLDAVLDRRLGIPITLAIVVIGVGRRLGVNFAPVGMPGHFLISHEGVLLDPFAGGRGVSLEECAERFRTIHGPQARFDPAMLERARPHDVIARILANLRQIHMTSGDSAQLEWVLRLRALLPNASVEDRTERAGVLAALARFDDAADVLEEVVADDSARVGDERRAVLQAKATQLRSRLN